MYSDQYGDLHIYLVDSLKAINARATVSSFIQGEGGWPRNIRIVKGRYDILQLREWQPSVDILLSLPGVLSTDLDEANNRFRVTVLEPSAQNEVYRRLEADKFRLIAVVVELGKAAEPLATLSSPLQPLRGGNIVTSGGGEGCSMGVTAIDNFDRIGFITASHCTGANIGDGVNGTAFYQPTLFSTLVGTEVTDPLLFSCMNGTRMCRYSDAAFIQFNNPSAYSDLGRLHKTMYRSFSNGSTTINSSDPFFTIIEETPFPISSEIGDLVLNKMGRSSGWTNGRLKYTCANRLVSGTNIVLLCQDAAGSLIEEGDSGAPVFRKVGDRSADLYGIVWGSDQISEDPWFIFWFSSIWNIEYELFFLETF